MIKKFEVYIDNNNHITLLEYNNINSEYENRKVKGRDAINYLNLIAKSRIREIIVDENKDILSLEYENCVVYINEYSVVLKRKDLFELEKNIQKHVEDSNLEEQKPRKVKRTNKHVGAKIIASGITLLILASIATPTISAYKGNQNDNTTSVYTEGSIVEKENTEFIELSTEEPTIIDITTTEEAKTKSLQPKVEFLSLNYSDNPVIISLEYEDRSETDKADMTKSYYGDILEKYAKRYGLDPKLVTGIATQERGIHSTTMDSGGATGLMQIQNSVWIGESLSAYNFESGETETIEITKDDLANVYDNVKIGCMILQKVMGYMDYNILAGIQCYNMGYGNMKKVLRSYSYESGRSVEDILSDPSDIGWLDHRNLINEGDRHYIEHVLSWIGQEVNINTKKTDGSLVELNVNNMQKVY